MSLQLLLCINSSGTMVDCYKTTQKSRLHGLMPSKPTTSASHHPPSPPPPPLHLNDRTRGPLGQTLCPPRLRTTSEWSLSPLRRRSQNRTEVPRWTLRVSKTLAPTLPVTVARDVALSPRRTSAGRRATVATVPSPR